MGGTRWIGMMIRGRRGCRRREVGVEDVVEEVGVEEVEEGVAAIDVVDVVGAAGEDEEEEVTTFGLAPEAGAV